MLTSVIPSAARVAASSSTAERTYDVRQKAQTTGTTIGIGRPSHWASDPKSLTVAGKTYPTRLLDVFWVWLPILPDGLHKATVTLANGVKCPITLRVSTVS